MKIEKIKDNIVCFTLKNENGMTVEILNLGAIIKSVVLANGTDVVLGYDNIDDYLENPCYFGAAIGRYANRISGAEFNLNGKTYKLDKNNGQNCLHGGFEALNAKVFEYRICENTLKLYYTIKDMADNFPGDLDIEISYTLSEENELKIEYNAVSNKDTIVNLTNHSYFNMDGHEALVLDNILQIHSNKITFNDENSIPTGEILDITSTAMDFNEPKAIGRDIEKDDINLKNGFGYDHNYIVNDKKEMKLIATVKGTKASMEAYTDCPCVQFYSANFVDNIVGKKDVIYKKRSALCLETGIYPNAINVENFPSPVLLAGETWNYTTIYKFI